MGVQGKLTKDKFGFSMPVNAPLYPKPPYLYKGATMLLFEYVTDPEVASNILPAELSVSDSAMAGLVFAHYPWSSLGAYDEVIVYLKAMFQGREVQYAAYLYVTTDAAMAAGREMGGYPKKIAKIDIDSGVCFSGRMERPSGIPLCSGVLAPQFQAPAAVVPIPMTFNYITLRLIPSPQKDAPPTLAELLETTWTLTKGEAWVGSGSCSFTGASALDPLHMVPIVKPVASLYITGDMVVEPNPDRKEYAL